MPAFPGGVHSGLVAPLARRNVDTDAIFPKQYGRSTARGGFGAFVLHLLSDRGVLDRGIKFRTLVLPDVFQDHDKPELQYALAGLDAAGIAGSALEALGLDAAGLRNLRA